MTGRCPTCGAEPGRGSKPPPDTSWIQMEAVRTPVAPVLAMAFLSLLAGVAVVGCLWLVAFGG